jgi:regulator of sigma E protease
VGGFCELEGEEKESSSEHSLGKIAIWKRAVIMVSGGLMNLLIGLVFSVILTLSHENIPTTVVSGFDESAVSSRTGLKANDEILSINSYKTYTNRDVFFALNVGYDKNNGADFEILRNGKYVLIKNVKIKNVRYGDTSAFEIDFHLLRAKKTIANIINYSIVSIISLVRLSWKSIVDLVSGKLTIKDMSGPVGMAMTIGEITDQGLKSSIGEAILNVLSFMTMFTISIGMFNLLPFPALDGGRVMMFIPESITGKPMNQKVESAINTVGFCLLILLMLAISYNDIARIVRNLFSSSINTT